jgi:4-diphosphocytidyl-2-C-methyl-D-erythritol kinase
MMQTVAETAYAKINLALHVRRRRADGYHDIETLFAFSADGDRLSATPSDALSMLVSGQFGEGLTTDASNLVLQTALRMQQHFNVAQGAALHLDKRLPIASGIGGGSADAAATARLLNALWELSATEEELARLLAPLGADIPACVYSRASFGRGTGTELELLDGSALSGKHLLLVNPLQAVSTAAIFSAWDGIDRGPIEASGLWQSALSGRNDLEPIAAGLCPAISEILRDLTAHNALLTRMSGSGATCFAIFDSDRTAIEAQATMNPSYWTMRSTLR